MITNLIPTQNDKPTTVHPHQNATQRSKTAQIPHLSPARRQNQRNPLQKHSAVSKNQRKPGTEERNSGQSVPICHFFTARQCRVLLPLREEGKSRKEIKADETRKALKEDSQRIQKEFDDGFDDLLDDLLEELWGGPGGPCARGRDGGVGRC